jgi:hypothetical protein
MKPEGISKKTKDNSNKRPYEREQWTKKKREGRQKQEYDLLTGTWKKVTQ